MRFSFFVVGAIIIAAPIARAQEVAPNTIAPTSHIAQNSDKSGYQTLVAAGKLILPGENGNPAKTDRNLTPQENLRRQRVAVARNASALKLLREALKMPIDVPVFTNNEDVVASFEPNSHFRAMARQLIQESDVRAADGDFVGAVDSRLTALELGAAVSRGSIISMLVGAAIESIGRHNIETIAAKLDAPQIRAALERMKAVSARRATYSQNLQAEKTTAVHFALANSREFLESDQATRLRNIQKLRQELKISEAQAREVIALTPQTLTGQLSRVLDGFIAREELPYKKALKVRLTPATNVFIRNLAYPLDGIYATSRFNYERNRSAHLLLQSALELRAIQLESGAYPAIFEAPLDPFGDNEPLVYERKGDGYSLYSIGPDGINNGGRAFPRTRQRFNTDTGQMQTTAARAVQHDSKGDMLAPILP